MKETDKDDDMSREEAKEPRTRQDVGVQEACILGNCQCPIGLFVLFFERIN